MKPLRWALVAVLAAGCAKEPPRPEAWIGAPELAEVANASPRGAALIAEGEAARRRGDADGAIDAYRRAALELPTRDQARRFECMLQAERGRQAEALAACEQAVSVKNTPDSRRAQAGALMSARGQVTSVELAQAVDIAHFLLRTWPQSPQGYAAMCDIARKLGDERMLAVYMEKLEKIPGSEVELARQQRALTRSVPNHGLYAGWALLLVVLAGTALHALVGVLRRSRAKLVAPASILLLLLLPSAARAAEPELSYGLSSFGINDADPESNLPTLQELNESPLQAGYLLMDLAEKAEQAEKAGRFLHAARYYRALAALVPERATAFGKLCAAYEAGGDRVKALEACTSAVGKKGVRLEDYARFARLQLAGGETFTPEQIGDLDAVVQHLRAQGPDAAKVGEKIACDLGHRLGDQKRLSECTAALLKAAPGDPQVASYQWSLALLKKDYALAQKHIQRAKELGVRAEVLEQMHFVTAETIPWWRRHGLLPPVLGSLVFLLALGLGLGRLWSRRAPAQALRAASL